MVVVGGGFGLGTFCNLSSNSHPLFVLADNGPNGLSNNK